MGRRALILLLLLHVALGQEKWKGTLARLKQTLKGASDHEAAGAHGSNAAHRNLKVKKQVQEELIKGLCINRNCEADERCCLNKAGNVNCRKKCGLEELCTDHDQCEDGFYCCGGGLGGIGTCQKDSCPPEGGNGCTCEEQCAQGLLCCIIPGAKEGICTDPTTTSTCGRCGNACNTDNGECCFGCDCISEGTVCENGERCCGGTCQKYEDNCGPCGELKCVEKQWVCRLKGGNPQCTDAETPGGDCGNCQGPSCVVDPSSSVPSCQCTYDASDDTGCSYGECQGAMCESVNGGQCYTFYADNGLCPGKEQDLGCAQCESAGCAEDDANCQCLADGDKNKSPCTDPTTACLGCNTGKCKDGLCVCAFLDDPTTCDPPAQKCSANKCTSSDPSDCYSTGSCETEYYDTDNCKYCDVPGGRCHTCKKPGCDEEYGEGCTCVIDYMKDYDTICTEECQTTPCNRGGCENGECVCVFYNDPNATGCDCKVCNSKFCQPTPSQTDPAGECAWEFFNTGCGVSDIVAPYDGDLNSDKTACKAQCKIPRCDVDDSTGLGACKCGPVLTPDECTEGCVKCESGTCNTETGVCVCTENNDPELSDCPACAAECQARKCDYTLSPDATNGYCSCELYDDSRLCYHLADGEPACNDCEKLGCRHGKCVCIPDPDKTCCNPQASDNCGDCQAGLCETVWVTAEDGTKEEVAKCTCNGKAPVGKLCTREAGLPACHDSCEAPACDANGYCTCTAIREGKACPTGDDCKAGTCTRGTCAPTGLTGTPCVRNDVGQCEYAECVDGTCTLLPTQETEKCCKNDACDPQCQKPVCEGPICKCTNLDNEPCTKYGCGDKACAEAKCLGGICICSTVKNSIEKACAGPDEGCQVCYSPKCVQGEGMDYAACQCRPQNVGTVCDENCPACQKGTCEATEEGGRICKCTQQPDDTPCTAGACRKNGVCRGGECVGEVNVGGDCGSSCPKCQKGKCSDRGECDCSADYEGDTCTFDQCNSGTCTGGRCKPTPSDSPCSLPDDKECPVCKTAKCTVCKESEAAVCQCVAVMEDPRCSGSCETECLMPKCDDIKGCICDVNPAMQDQKCTYMGKEGKCCGGKCTIVSEDDGNCGQCDRKCDKFEKCCDGSCVDFKKDDDPLNCGGCGLKCADGKVCCDGKCCDNCCDGKCCNGSCCDGKKCCDKDETCCRGKCYPGATVCLSPDGASEKCCLNGDQCCGGDCCPSGQCCEKKDGTKTCCKTGETCSCGKCCAPDRRCGKECLPSGGSCCGGTVCQNGEWCCEGKTCVKGGSEKCCRGGFKCSNEEECCGRVCAPKGKCCGTTVCGEDETCCGGRCAKKCCNDTPCAADGLCCGDKGDKCCDKDQMCCGGKCRNKPALDDEKNCGDPASNKCGVECGCNELCCDGVCKHKSSVSDRNNCGMPGMCGKKCDAGHLCCNGVCKLQGESSNTDNCGTGCTSQKCDAATQDCCGGTCTLKNDPTKCGLGCAAEKCPAGKICCDNSCWTPPSGPRVCGTGCNAKTCALTENCCSGQCKPKPTLFDPENCGASADTCGVKCTETSKPFCCNGECKATSACLPGCCALTGCKSISYPRPPDSTCTKNCGNECSNVCTQVLDGCATASSTDCYYMSTTGDTAGKPIYKGSNGKCYELGTNACAAQNGGGFNNGDCNNPEYGSLYNTCCRCLPTNNRNQALSLCPGGTLVA